MFKILCRYSPETERHSVNLYFSDNTRSENLSGEPVEIACRIKNQIKEVITASIIYCKYQDM
jgi:hypothetical protein